MQWFGVPRLRFAKTHVDLLTMHAGLVAIPNSPAVLTFD
jgi:hypothetical protein